MSKTMISNWLKIILGGLVGAGFMPAETMATVMANADTIMASGLIIWGAIDGWIRNVTSGPLASWWGKKEA